MYWFRIAMAFCHNDRMTGKQWRGVDNRREVWYTHKRILLIYKPMYMI